MNASSWHDFRTQAGQNPARIVLADGEDPRVIEAAALANQNRIAVPLLIGSRSRIQPQWEKFSRSQDIPLIESNDLSNTERERLIQRLLQLTKFKNLSKVEAEERIKDPLVLGCLYVLCGLADGFVGGATRTTADTLKAVFSIIGLAPRTSTLFGFFLIEKRSEAGGSPFVLLADCAVIPEPSAKQLANIAIGAAAAYEFFAQAPARTAFLSFSTQGSASHPMVEKVRQAVAMAREKAPELTFEGEWQADAALDTFSAQIKGVGNSSMAGQANVLIAPDLNCGNIAYKLIQRLGGCRAVGPVLWGTALPANDLSRGCSMEDVLDMMALTTLQVQKEKRAETTAHAH